MLWVDLLSYFIFLNALCESVICKENSTDSDCLCETKYESITNYTFKDRYIKKVCTVSNVIFYCYVSNIYAALPSCGTY